MHSLPCPEQGLAQDADHWGGRAAGGHPSDLPQPTSSSSCGASRATWRGSCCRNPSAWPCPDVDFATKLATHAPGLEAVWDASKKVRRCSVFPLHKCATHALIYLLSAFCALQAAILS